MTTHPTPKSSNRAVKNPHLAADLSEPPVVVPERSELVELALAAVDDPAVVFDLLDQLDDRQTRDFVMRLAQTLALVALAPAGVDPAWFVGRVDAATSTPIDPAGGAS